MFRGCQLNSWGTALLRLSDQNRGSGGNNYMAFRRWRATLATVASARGAPRMRSGQAQRNPPSASPGPILGPQGRRRAYGNLRRDAFALLKWPTYASSVDVR